MKISIDREQLAGKEYTRESVLPHEGAFLMDLVTIFQPKTTVEIGSWIGVSTIYLAKAQKELGAGKVWAVDPHEESILHKRQKLPDTESILRENLKIFDVLEFVQVVRKSSLEALRDWNSPIDLLFIDGSHYFKNVREDFFGWSPWVPSDGILAFHDYPTRSGVKRVVDEIVRPSNLWDEIGVAQKLIAFRRRK